VFTRDGFENFLLQVLPNDRIRRRFAWLVVFTLLGLNVDTLVLPVTVGFRAAGALVDHESELRLTQRRIAEYRAATEYFSTPEGREFARRLLYNESRDNERRARLVPRAAEAAEGPIARSKKWYADRKDRGRKAGRRALQLGKRLTSDPPVVLPPTDAVGPTQAQEVLRDQIQGHPQTPGPASPPSTQ